MMKAKCETRTMLHRRAETLDAFNRICPLRVPSFSNVPVKKWKCDIQTNAALQMIMNQNSNYLSKFSDKNIPFFLGVKCNYDVAIKIFFGWSVGINFKDLAVYLDIEECIVKYFYMISTRYVKKYISSHIEEWKIGGGNTVVLIDTYPEGCSKFNLRRSNQNISVLCIAEAKDIPPNYWFEILDGDNLEEKTCKVLNIIQTIVRPGSILVTDSNSIICPCNILRQKFHHIYPVIVNIDDLTHHNNEHQNLLDNLKTIWQPALLVCENGSYHTDTQSYYTSYLWNQKFGNDGLGILLNQL